MRGGISFYSEHFQIFVEEDNVQMKVSVGHPKAPHLIAPVEKKHGLVGFEVGLANPREPLNFFFRGESQTGGERRATGKGQGVSLWGRREEASETGEKSEKERLLTLQKNTSAKAWGGDL